MPIAGVVPKVRAQVTSLDGLSLLSTAEATPYARRQGKEAGQLDMEKASEGGRLPPFIAFALAGAMLRRCTRPGPINTLCLKRCH